MINNIANIDTPSSRGVLKTSTSQFCVPTMPPLLSFKTPKTKEKAIIRVKKFRRRENIVIAGDIDENYVDIVETETPQERYSNSEFNFFRLQADANKTKFLKNCYVIDYIQSPQPKQGLGTNAIKALAEKAMFDPIAEGRIVTFCVPVWKESSPAIFFYKLGFRFLEASGNEYIQTCIDKKIPDIPAQVGMMYLPKQNLHKLLRYGDLC